VTPLRRDMLILRPFSRGACPAFSRHPRGKPRGQI